MSQFSSGAEKASVGLAIDGSDFRILLPVPNTDEEKERNLTWVKACLGMFNPPLKTFTIVNEPPKR